MQALSTFQVSNQSVGLVQNLESCRNLVSLHLNENKITRITGLENLVNLQQLYL